MRRKQKWEPTVRQAWAIVILAVIAVIGYCWNWIKIISALIDFETLSGLGAVFMLRLFSAAVWPLGSVVGYF